jgi:hypothetical protein
MNRKVIFRILILNLLFCLHIPLETVAQTFSEILGRPTDKSITVNIMFSQQVQVYTEWGTNQGNYTGFSQPVTANANEPVEIIFPGLVADSRYYYRTRYRNPGEIIYKAGTEHVFMTQRAPGRSFRFTVESDPHPYDKKCYPPLWNIALQNQLKDTADFMIDMGDTFGDDHNPFTITDKEVQQLHLDTRDYFSKVCYSLPFFFCPGNHEGESGYYLLQTPPNNLAVYETLWRKQYWPNPFPDGFYSGNITEEAYGIGLPENYYAWEWGDALFVVLDAYRYYTASAKPGKWDWTIGKTQYDWLKRTLGNSTSKFKFVFIHHLLGEARGVVNLARQFEWGGYDQKGTTWEFTSNRPGWEMPIHQLLVKNKVSVLFQGHDHLYAREELDGLVYQTVPMPSDSSYTLGMIANGDAFSGTKLTGSGHLRVTVSSEKVQVDFVNAILPKDETAEKKNGSTSFSYTINQSGGTTSILSMPEILPIIQICPNPFHNSTDIQFSLKQKGKVEIFIFDSSGRLIDCIDAGIMESGQNTIRWNAVSKNVNPADQETYICLIKSPDGKSSAKMIREE